MWVGYVRPSSHEEAAEIQAEALIQMNCTRIIEETFVPSGERYLLYKALQDVKDGDKIVVVRLQVLADSLLQLMEILKKLDQQRISLLSLEDGLDTEVDTPLSFMETTELLADFQKKAISQSTKTGLLKAREQGAQVGRPRKSPEKINEAIMMYRSGKYTFEEIKKMTSVGKTTIYRYLK